MTGRLLIANAQLDQIAAEQERAFIARLVAQVTNLRADEGKAPWDSERVLAFVHEQLARARGYGIVDARDLKTYVDSAVVFGPHFDTDSALSSIASALSDPGLAGSAKADILHDHLIFRT
jgi:hypothetical protein